MSYGLVSIIIPVYNDPQGIRATIESLLSQLTHDNVSILIVDNGSTDNTRNVIDGYVQDQESIHVLSEDKIQGAYAARNKGLRAADSEIIAFLDADESVSEQWIKHATEAMQEQDVDYLGCNVELTLAKKTLIGKYNAYTGFPVKQYLEKEHYAPTCALLVRQELFEDVGLFDARLVSGGDREFGDRVHEAGYDQGYTEDATVYHPARTAFESLAKKNFRVGRGFCQKQRHYPERYGRPGIPPTPSDPSGGDDESEPDSLFARLAFVFLSIAMLACRGLGYYYEFLFGEGRDDIPAPTS